MGHMASGHTGREEPFGSWEMGHHHSGGVEHVAAMNQLPAQVR